MTITLTWDSFFMWLGRLACGALCVVVLIYTIGIIHFSIGASGWTFRNSWLGRKLRRRRASLNPGDNKVVGAQEEDRNVQK